MTGASIVRRYPLVPFPVWHKRYENEKEIRVMAILLPLRRQNALSNAIIGRK